MSLSARAIAVQGLGFTPRLVALQGFSAFVTPQPNGGGGRRRYRYVTRVRGRYRSFEDELEALAQQDPDIEAGPLPDKPVTVQELRDLGRKTEQQALVRDFLHVQRSPMAMAAFRAWLLMLLVQHDDEDVELLLMSQA